MIKVKKDSYSRSRGAARFYLVVCSSCKEKICYYQKDGPGLLKRMYKDRIFHRDTRHENLECGCGNLLGTGMIYKKENREAYRLYAGSVKKTMISQKDIKEG